MREVGVAIGVHRERRPGVSVGEGPVAVGGLGVSPLILQARAGTAPGCVAEKRIWGLVPAEVFGVVKARCGLVAKGLDSPFKGFHGLVEPLETLEEHGLVISGLSPDGDLVEMIEFPDHPFFIASQFHPELKSRPQRAHPLFKGLVHAAKERKRAREGERDASAAVRSD